MYVYITTVFTHMHYNMCMRVFYIRTYFVCIILTYSMYVSIIHTYVSCMYVRTYFVNADSKSYLMCWRGFVWFKVSDWIQCVQIPFESAWSGTVSRYVGAFTWWLVCWEFVWTALLEEADVGECVLHPNACDWYVQYMYSTGTLQFWSARCTIDVWYQSTCVHVRTYVRIFTTHSVHWCHVHIVGAVWHN